MCVCVCVCVCTCGHMLKRHRGPQDHSLMHNFIPLPSAHLCFPEELVGISEPREGNGGEGVCVCEGSATEL